MSADSHLKLPDEISITNISEWKSKLTVFLEQTPPLTLDASELVRVDTAAIQMFAAFAIKAKTAEIDFVWENPSDTFKTTAKQLGMSDYLTLA